MIGRLAGLRVSRALVGLLLASWALLTLWSLAVPIFEAPDEPTHWQYAYYLREKLRLPVYGPGFAEGNSPPLYYLLMAPLAVDSKLPPLAVPREPEAAMNASARHEPQLTSRTDFESYSWEAVRLVWSGTTPVFRHSAADFGQYWPIYIARLATALISVLTVLFAYLAGWEATGRRTTGLLAGGITALLPLFTFRGMNVSNDALVAATSAAAVYLIVRMVRRGFTWALGLAAAAATALAFLSKPTAIFLPATLSLTILSEAAPWPMRFKRLAVLGVALLMVAPWIARNQVLYGDPLAQRAMFTAVSGYIDVKPLTSPYFTTTFPLLLSRSFVGIFGWMTVRMPERLYQFFGFLAVVSALGYVWRAFERRLDRRLTLLLVTLPLSNLLVLIYMNLSLTQPQGRYMLPALSAVALLAALGFEGLPRWSPRLSVLVIGVMALANLYILSTVILPVYWTLPSVSQEAGLADLGPLSGRFTVGQTFVSPCAGLDRIDVYVAGNGPPHTGTVTFNVFVADAAEAVVQQQVDAARIAGGSYLPVYFASMPESRGRRYYFQLASPETRLGQGIRLASSSENMLDGGAAVINGAPANGDLKFRAYCAGDRTIERWVARLHQIPKLYTSAAVLTAIAAGAIVYLEDVAAKRNKGADGAVH